MADTPTTPAGQAPNGDGTPPGQAPSNPDGQAPNETPNLTVEELKKIVEDLRKEQASNRNKLRAQEQAQAKAEEERLKKQGEFQTLAEQREAELNTVKPQYEAVQGKYDKLSELLGKQLEETIKDWPAEVKAFDPGKDAGVEARMEWINKSKPLVAKLLGQQQQQRQAGLVRSPEPNNNQNGRKTREDYEKEFRVARPF